MLGASALPSQAVVTVFDAAKIRQYTQSSNTSPFTPSVFYFDGRVFYDDPNDFEAVSLGIDRQGEFSFLEPLTVTDTQVFYRSIYGDESEFDTDFSNGSVFAFGFGGGNLDGQGGSLTLVDNLSYPEIPFLTGTSFSNLQGFDPSQSLTLTINGFTADPNASFNEIFLQIFPATSSSIIFEALFLVNTSNTSTSIDIPANALTPNTAYFFNLDYRVSSITGEFNGVNGFSSLLSRTFGEFSTGSLPGTNPEEPLLPILDPENPDVFTFPDIPVVPDQIFFFDPDVAVGYDYTVTGGPLFASVLIPNSLPLGDDEFLLELGSFGNFPLFAGTTFDLLSVNSLGFDSFRISGIDTNERLDPTDPLAFVTGLGFTGAGTVTVTQTPIIQNIPDTVGTSEPSSIAGLGLLGGGLLLKRRRK
jgi:hypothetical protein